MRKTGKNLIVLTEVDSTNNYANRLILSNTAEEGTAVLAQYQNAGRGQSGNTWESEPGKNFLCSIILYPNFLQAEKQFLISKLVSLALFDWIGENTPRVSIKWPNDLYVSDKKIGGILIENTIKGQYLLHSIAGIGLNLNQEKFMPDLPNPISLKQLTGKNYDVEEVAHEILERIYYWYGKLEMGLFKMIDNSYYSNLYRKEVWSKFRNKDAEFEGRITGIDDYGQLKIEKRTGEINTYMFKEVEFIL